MRILYYISFKYVFLRCLREFEKVVRGGKNEVKWGKMGVKWLSQNPQLYTTLVKGKHAFFQGCEKSG